MWCYWLNSKHTNIKSILLRISNFGITIWQFLQVARDKYKIQNFTLPINWWYTITNFGKHKNFDQIGGPVWDWVCWGVIFNVISKTVCLQHKLLIIPTLNMPLTKFLFLIDSTEISVWSPVQKRNLKSFKANNKIIKKKVDNKVVQLHEEKNLLTRFLITARNRPELNL